MLLIQSIHSSLYSAMNSPVLRWTIAYNFSSSISTFLTLNIHPSLKRLHDASVGLQIYNKPSELRPATRRTVLRLSNRVRRCHNLIYWGNRDRCKLRWHWIVDCDGSMTRAPDIGFRKKLTTLVLLLRWCSAAMISHAPIDHIQFG